MLMKCGSWFTCLQHICYFKIITALSISSWLILLPLSFSHRGEADISNAWTRWFNILQQGEGEVSSVFSKSLACLATRHSQTNKSRQGLDLDLKQPGYLAFTWLEQQIGYVNSHSTVRSDSLWILMAQWWGKSFTWPRLPWPTSMHTSTKLLVRANAARKVASKLAHLKKSFKKKTHTQWWTNRLLLVLLVWTIRFPHKRVHFYIVHSIHVE